MVQSILRGARRTTGDHQRHDCVVLVLGFDVRLCAIERQVAVVVRQCLDRNDVVGGQLMFDRSSEGLGHYRTNRIAGCFEVAA